MALIGRGRLDVKLAIARLGQAPAERAIGLHVDPDGTQRAQVRRQRRGGDGLALQGDEGEILRPGGEAPLEQEGAIARLLPKPFAHRAAWTGRTWARSIATSSASVQPARRKPSITASWRRWKAFLRKVSRSSSMLPPT